MNRVPQSVLWRVSGDVQRVGYRAYVKRCALGMSVDGWVRNMESGDVLIHARGVPVALEQFRTLILDSVSGARVAHLEELDSAPEAPPSSPFSINR